MSFSPEQTLAASARVVHDDVKRLMAAYENGDISGVSRAAAMLKQTAQAAESSADQITGVLRF